MPLHPSPGAPGTTTGPRVIRSVVAIVALALAVVTVVVSPAGTRPVEAAPSDTTAYVPVGPARLADTRRADCGCSRPDASTVRVRVAGRSGVPVDAVAVAVTVTAAGATRSGFVSVHPTGTARPNTSIVNVSAGEDTANSTIVRLGDDGSIDLYVDADTAVIVDVTGAFVEAATARAGRFVPYDPTRLIDTRVSPAPTGPLVAGESIDVPLPPGVASDATAVAVTVTSVSADRPGYLTAADADGPVGDTSFANLDGSGTPRAATLIVPVGPDGFRIVSTAGGHLLVDLTGWFTGPSAASSTDGLFVALDPTRVLDTRGDAERIWPGGAVELDVDDVAPGAAAVVANVTATRADAAGYVTAAPAGRALPDVSVLNPRRRDDTVPNLAITPLSTRGLAIYSDAGTDLLVDVMGAFIGARLPASRPPLPNDRPPSRVLLMGDSTLAAIGWYGQETGLRGFDPVLDAESCRRLATTSCRGRFGDVPTNAVTAIQRQDGWFDTVVVMAGYDDWWTIFPESFDAVVHASRAKGARTIVWLTFREGVGYVAPGGVSANEAFVRNNVTLREKVSSGAYPDVVLADWDAYTEGTTGWLTADGIHLTIDGALATADYVSRVLAHLEGRPCPMPLTPGGTIADPCGDPDVVGPVPDVRALYG